MKEIKDALWENYNSVMEVLNHLDMSTDEYRLALDEKDRIMNEIIKVEQIERETFVKKYQVESDNKNEKIRNAVSIGTLVLSVAISLYGMNKTFKFEETGSITSTIGRGMVNGFVPKFPLFKR